MVYRTAVNRVAAGRVTGGQFAHKTHGESTAEIEEEKVVDTHSLISSSTKPVNLITISPEDSLSSSQINAALAGKWDDVDDSVENSFSAQRYAAAYTRACDEVDAAYEQGRFHKTALDLDEEEVSQAVLAVMEKDTEPPTAALLKQTPPQVMRGALGHPAARMERVSQSFNGDTYHDDVVIMERSRAVSGILSEHGISPDSEEMQRAIREFVVLGPSRWDDKIRVDVIWRGDVSEATVCPRGKTANGWREITFENPDVVIIDPRTGEGDVMAVPGKLRKTLTPDSPAFLDTSENRGYGWAGVSGYNPDITSPETTDWI